MRNEYEIRGEVTAIYINSKKYGRIETLISTNKLNKAQSFPFNWGVRWCKGTNSFYVQGNLPKIDGKKSKVFLHRWISDSELGVLIDHINHDTLNNTDSNLRRATFSENCQNRSKARRDSSSGVRGVYFDKDKNRWRAQCTINGVVKRLGRYKTLEEAERAAIEGRKKFLPFSPEAREQAV